ncbi:MAG: glycosyltransferase family 4 protein [Gammaproteobacteria bacterium]
MKPLKVLHCTHALSGGGAERQLDLLCAHEHQHGLEHSTFYMEAGKAAVHPDRHLIRFHRRHKLDLGVFRSVGEAIDTVKPDLVHAWLPPVMTVPACVMANRRGVPIVTSFRSAKRFRNWLGLIDFCTSWALGNGVISNTLPQLCQRPYQRMFDRQHGRLIPNAVSVPAVDDLNAPTRSENFQVLYVGRIVPEKNWQCMASALSLLPANTPIRLSVCGDGFELAAFEKMVAEKDVGHLIEFEGYVSDVYQRIVNADALLLPSWTEGMPNVVVEAMALSTPTILSDIGANRAIVGDSQSSLMFDPNKPLELAQRLEQLAGDPGLAKKLAQRGKIVAEGYTVDRMVSAYREYYDDVLARARS